MPRPLILLASAVLFGASLSAQNYRFLPASQMPATSELNRWNSVPLMRAGSRIQTFFDATETGAATFMARSASLRYDGTIPAAGSPGPYTIGRLRLRAGVTTIGTPSPAFAVNLGPIHTTVFDRSVNYLASPNPNPLMPWGAQGGQFTFPFATPLAVQVPSPGWFLLEMIVEANDNQGAAHAMLDAAHGNGGAVNGMAQGGGTGCPPGPSLPDANIGTAGIYAPGGAWSVFGANLGAGAPVITVLGTRDDLAFGTLPLPFQVPSTSCTLHTSWDLTFLQVADAGGTIPSRAPGSFVIVPPDPSLDRLVLHHQLVSVVPAANPTGLVFSNKQSVTLGSWSTPTQGFYYVADEFAATGEVATSVQPLAFALRIETN